jgi:hypothetical protein
MLNNLKGKVFGKLKVIDIAPRTCTKTYWICECECGVIKTIRSDSLVSGNTTSCGCLKIIQNGINFKTEYRKNNATRICKTRLYKTWQLMNNRCYNKKTPGYIKYGARGITVCEEWQRQTKFDTFKNWALKNGYNDTLSIERINNNGNYEPENCKWSTNKEQCNNRRSTVKITMNGQTKSVKQWCEYLNLDYGRVINRRQKGISQDKMFSKEDLRKVR